MTSKYIQSVVRAGNILEYIIKKDGAGVSEIARYLDLNKSTAFGLIKTLEYLGYIFKDVKTEKYEVSLKLHSMLVDNIEDQQIVKYSTQFLEPIQKSMMKPST